MKSKKIGVVCGGLSGERGVSLRSGKNVADALIRKGYNVTVLDPLNDSLLSSGMDVLFLALHGQMGEDGAVQAMLDNAGIPYTGSGVAASVIGMNKIASKWMFLHHGIPTAPFQILADGPWELTLPTPIIIKPANEGSSLGVEIVDDPAQLQSVVARLTDHYGMCLAEQFIAGAEITVGVIDTANGPKALPILELRPQNRFYDYDAKYTPGKTDFIIPAELPEAVTLNCQHIAIETHVKLGCRGMSRTDMIVNPESGPYVLEVNTIPGMTDTSDLPAQAKAAGIAFDDLVEGILLSVALN
ncbi:D-alanine--D-alanine ligase [bacterium]|nr:D-alanine--D-alanine ligase [bacterium]